MKNIILPTVALAIITVMTFSCNQPSDKKSDQQVNDSSGISQTQALPEPVKNDTGSSDASTTLANQDQSAEGQTKAFSIAPIVKDYLALKNALVADNDKAAASAGKQLFNTLKSVDMKSIPADKHKVYMEIAENAKENAEHIGENAGKINHQREHLASLSKDVNDLIAMFGTTQKLYQDHCPMYNDGKGAIWISEVKTIKNPYYGSQMLTCGAVKKEL